MTATATTPATQPAPSAPAQPAVPPPAEQFPLASALVAHIATLPPHPKMPVTMEAKWRLAEIYFNSRILPKGIDSIEKVYVALDYGEMLGLHPLIALQNMAVIGNRPSLMTDCMLGVCMSTGLLEWKKEDVRDDGATITMKRKGHEPLTISFTLADAAKAGLDKKETYRQYGKDMMRARAMSRACKRTFPDLLAGLLSEADAESLAESEPAPPPASKAAPTSAPSFRMTERLWGDIKLLAAHRKLDGPALADVIREATSGREVARDAKGVPAFTQDEHDAIRRWIDGWKAKPASGPTAAPQPAAAPLDAKKEAAKAALDGPGVDLFEAGAEPDVTDEELDAEGR